MQVKINITTKNDQIPAIAEFTNLLATDPAGYRKTMGQVAQSQKDLTEQQKAMRGNALIFGKAVHAFNRAYETGIAGVDEGRAWKSQPTYLGRTKRESLCVFIGVENAKNVLNREQSVANALRLIDCGLIEEKHADNNSVDALCAASEVITKSRDQLFAQPDGTPDLEKTHEAIVEVARLLKEGAPNGAVAKAIRAVKDRMVVQKDEKGIEQVVLLSEDDAKELAERVSPEEAAQVAANLTKRGHTQAMMAELVATAKTEKTEEALHAFCDFLVDLRIALVQTHGEETAKAAYAAAANAKGGVQLLTPVPAK
jgi:hypothetical protein